MLSFELDGEGAVRACIDRLNGADPAAVCDASLQELIAAAIREYSHRVEHAGTFPVVPGRSITATDAMIATSALLKAANVHVFELGCWQNWAG
jgi:hypothetical protein